MFRTAAIAAARRASSVPSEPLTHAANAVAKGPAATPQRPSPQPTTKPFVTQSLQNCTNLLELAPFDVRGTTPTSEDLRTSALAEVPRKPWFYRLPTFLQPCAGTTYHSNHNLAAAGSDRDDAERRVGILQAILYGAPDPDHSQGVVQSGMMLRLRETGWRILHGNANADAVLGKETIDEEAVVFKAGEVINCGHGGAVDTNKLVKKVVKVELDLGRDEGLILGKYKA